MTRSSPSLRPRGHRARPAAPRGRRAVPVQRSPWTRAWAATPARWRAPSRTTRRWTRRGGGWASWRAATFPETRRFNLSMACNHCLEPTCLSGCPTKAYRSSATAIVRPPRRRVHRLPVLHLELPLRGAGVRHRPKDRVQVRHVPAPHRRGPEPGVRAGVPHLGHRPGGGRTWPRGGRTTPRPTPPGCRRRPSPCRPPGSCCPRPTCPTMTAADDHRVEPEDPHWPLVALTLLTQLSLGTVAATVVAAAGRGRRPGRAWRARRWAPSLAGAVALAASLLHLGRPARAFKALRNVRTSWLSREVALFSAFSGLSLAYAALASGAGSVAALGVAVVAGRGRRLRQRPPLPGAGPAGVELVAHAGGLLRHRPGHRAPAGPTSCLDRAGAGRGLAGGAGGRGRRWARWPSWRCRSTWRVACGAGTDRQHQGTAHLLLDRFGGRFQGRLASGRRRPAAAAGGAAGPPGRAPPPAAGWPRRWSWWPRASCRALAVLRDRRPLPGGRELLPDPVLNGERDDRPTCPTTPTGSMREDGAARRGCAPPAATARWAAGCSSGSRAARR